MVVKGSPVVILFEYLLRIFQPRRFGKRNFAEFIVALEYKRFDYMESKYTFGETECVVNDDYNWFILFAMISASWIKE